MIGPIRNLLRHHMLVTHYAFLNGNPNSSSEIYITEPIFLLKKNNNNKIENSGPSENVGTAHQVMP